MEKEELMEEGGGRGFGTSRAEKMARYGCSMQSDELKG